MFVVVKKWRTHVGKQVVTLISIGSVFMLRSQGGQTNGPATPRKCEWKNKSNGPQKGCAP